MSDKKEFLNPKKGFKVNLTLKKHESDFETATKAIMYYSKNYYYNNVFDKLHEKTIKKFEDDIFFNDEQIGNYANVFTSLSDKAIKKLLKRFNQDRLNELAKKYLDKTNKYSKKQFYEKLSKFVGIDPIQLAIKERSSRDFNALVLQTAEYIERHLEGALNTFAADSLRLMSIGNSYEDVVKSYNKLSANSIRGAGFVARQQINTFSSLMQKIRAQKSNITEAFWVTSKDERVRPCHQVRDGKRFDIAKGLYSSCDGKTLLPGVDFNCRCTYFYVINQQDLQGRELFTDSQDIQYLDEIAYWLKYNYDESMKFLNL